MKATAALPRDTDVIVTFGCTFLGIGSLTQRRRLRAAASLYHEIKKTSPDLKIVFSCNQTKKEFTRAVAYLSELGVPVDAVVPELNSAKTHVHGQNLEPVLHAMSPQSLNVLAVTNQSHMPRIILSLRTLCDRHHLSFVAPKHTLGEIADAAFMGLYEWRAGAVNIKRQTFKKSDYIHAKRVSASYGRRRGKLTGPFSAVSSYPA